MAGTDKAFSLMPLQSGENCGIILSEKILAFRLMKRRCGAMTYEEAFRRLGRSRFRSRFHLTERDRAYIAEKGLDVIRRHAEDFVRTRLAPAVIPNDGKQTPMRGHPVFVAQHACACCCRGCLHKWYRVPLGTELTALQQEKIVNFLMVWIGRELQKQ